MTYGLRYDGYCTDPLSSHIDLWGMESFYARIRRERVENADMEESCALRLQNVTFTFPTAGNNDMTMEDLWGAKQVSRD